MVLRSIFAILISILFLLFSVSANAVTNQEMHKAIRYVSSSMGEISGIRGNVRYFSGIGQNVNESKKSFYFLIAGQPTSTGNVEIYKQPTSLENLGSKIVLKHVTRPIPNKFIEPVLNSKAVKGAWEDLVEEDDYKTTIERQGDRLHVQVVFTKDEFSKGELYDFFRDLTPFHSTLEDTINWAVKEYNDFIEDNDFEKIGDIVEVKIRGQKAKFSGAQVFHDVIGQPLDDNDEMGKNHWGYWASDGFQTETKLNSDHYEKTINVDVLKSLPPAKKKELLSKLQKKANDELPKKFEKAVVTLETGKREYARVAFIYKFDDRDGEDINEHFENYLDKDQDIFVELKKIADQYSGGKKDFYNLNEFVKFVTEDDLEIKDDEKKEGALGYWTFSIKGVTFVFANYGTKMMLSSSLGLSDSWTLEEIKAGNEKFKKELEPADYLNADRFEIGQLDGDPYEIWLKAEFDYSKRTTKELVKLYDSFMIGEGAGRKMIKKLRAAQGAGPLEE